MSCHNKENSIAFELNSDSPYVLRAPVLPPAIDGTFMIAIFISPVFEAVVGCSSFSDSTLRKKDPHVASVLSPTT